MTAFFSNQMYFTMTTNIFWNNIFAKNPFPDTQVFEEKKTFFMYEAKIFENLNICD